MRLLEPKIVGNARHFEQVAAFDLVVPLRAVFGTDGLPVDQERQGVPFSLWSRGVFIGTSTLAIGWSLSVSFLSSTGRPKFSCSWSLISS